MDDPGYGKDATDRSREAGTDSADSTPARYGSANYQEELRLALLLVQFRTLRSGSDRDRNQIVISEHRHVRGLYHTETSISVPA